MSRLATAILLSALVAVGLWAPRGWAAQTHNGNGNAAAEAAIGQLDIVKLITEAKTPDDNLKIAAWFEVQAKGARAEAARFGALSDCYSHQKNVAMERGVDPGAGVHARTWCGLQAHRYLTAAAEDQKLANMYRSIAERLAKTSK